MASTIDTTARSLGPLQNGTHKSEEAGAAVPRTRPATRKTVGHDNNPVSRNPRPRTIWRSLRDLQEEGQTALTAFLSSPQRGGTA